MFAVRLKVIPNRQKKIPKTKKIIDGILIGLSLSHKKVCAFFLTGIIVRIILLDHRRPSSSDDRRIASEPVSCVGQS